MARALSDAELERALEPVKDHFFGANLNTNTVLSAYLRAAGLHPSGQTWQMARFAVESGASFSDAVLLAGGEDPAASSGVAARATDDAEDRTGDAPDWPQPETETPAPEAPLNVYEEVPEESSGVRAQARPPSPALGPGAELAWFPKQFGPGDIDGEGAQKLLGTPDLAPVSVLVRETAQNSWDARLRGEHLEFILNLRELSDAEIGVLRTRVFTHDAGPIPVESTLRQRHIWVLEISDRGAKGLGGPLRNDLAIPEGQPTDFIDLVLNIGAPRDVHLGAGTYGFGKTISYTTSGLGTVLLWSRTEHEAELQHRLIGSAFGRSFEQAGKRHTGRHWWGVVPEGESRVEPLTGPDAQALAENLFARHFEGDETGTSILILDPVLGGDDREEDGRALVESALWHLWPKLVATSGGRDHMTIAVELNGVRLQMPEIGDHPVLSAFADALFAVRRAQGEAAPEPVNPTEVVTVSILRPAQTLGHLAITRFPKVEWDAAAREIVPLNEPVSHVALMRHDAELLVKYWERPELDSPAVQWCAVFKPASDTDDAFALSEPPSHDDWVASSVRDKGQKQVVNVALRRIREHIDEVLSPVEGDQSAQQAGTPSVAALADSLASLMGPVQGSAPRRKAPSKPGTRQTRPHVRIAEYRLGDIRCGYRRIAVRCVLESPDGAHRLSADVRIGVEGGAADVDDDAVRPLGWTSNQLDPDGTPDVLSSDSSLLQPGEEAWYVAEVSEDLVADFDVQVIKEDA